MGWNRLMEHQLKSHAVSGTAMAVAAHPDDIEFMMAGTLLRLKEVGWKLHCMNLANGCCGSLQHDAGVTARIREVEAREAAAILGATWHAPITNDLEIFYNDGLLRKLAAVLREVVPDILLIHSPSDYMEDHSNACRLAVSAAFVRGMTNYATDPSKAAVQHDVTLYHAMPHGLCDPFGDPVKPGMFVDVTGVMDVKRQALAAHASQKDWLDTTQGMDSYLQQMEDTAVELGQQSGRFRCAEGWRPHAHMGFCAQDANPLRDVLKPYYAT
jgi:N-acetylglucosamine malate deacetylase 1